MAALSAPAQGVWASKWRGIFILLPCSLPLPLSLALSLTYTHTHCSKHCHLCVQPWLTSGCTTGWSKVGKLAYSAGSAQVFDSFQRPLMFFAYPPPPPLPHHPPPPMQEIAFWPPLKQINEAGEGLHTVTSRPAVCYSHKFQSGTYAWPPGVVIYVPAHTYREKGLMQTYT